MIYRGKQVRILLANSINKVADAVASTLGPKGNLVLIKSRNGMHHATKDGVTVVENINFINNIDQMAADLLKEVARKTVEDAGDGTTTSIVLTASMISEFVKMEDTINVLEFKQEFKKNIEIIKQELIEASMPATIENVYKVAKVASNNDDTVFSIAKQAIDAVGIGSVIDVYNHTGEETYVEVVNGMKVSAGYYRRWMINTPELSTEYKEPIILVTNIQLSKPSDLKMIVSCLPEGVPLVIFCKDIKEEVLNVIYQNKKNFDLTVVIVPSIGMHQRNFMEDISVYTGAQFIEEDKRALNSIRFQDFGSCKFFKAGKHSCSISEGAGKKEEIEKAIELIKTDESTDTISVSNRDKRISALSGKAAIIHVGGRTSVEQKELRDRIDDVVGSVKSASIYGVSKGGGKALASCKPYGIFRFFFEEALKYPYDIIRNTTPEIDEDILDSTHVIVSALLNAASVALQIISTDTIIHEDEIPL